MNKKILQNVVVGAYEGGYPLSVAVRYMDVIRLKSRSKSNTNIYAFFVLDRSPG